MTVPYKRLRAAEQLARAQYPEALKIQAMWTPASRAGDICVEIREQNDQLGWRSRVIPVEV